jgi:hypothetical protein
MKWFLLFVIILLLPISLFSQYWSIEQVDSIAGDCSIGIDTENHPHISYCAGQVKYARWNGIAWEFQLVDTGWGHITAKICIDNQNYPRIAYTKDSVLFKYAYYDGNSWQISKVDSIDVGYYDVPQRCISMILSENGTPHISYPFVNPINSTRGIRYTFKSGDSWIIQTVWEESSPYLSTSAIDLDTAGHPVIAFENYHSAPIDTGYLYCARFNGQNWQIDTVHRKENEMYRVFSLKVDRIDRVHIFYKREFGVFYAVTQGDSWTNEFIDMNGLFEAAGDMILDGDKPKVVYSSIEDPLIYAYEVDTLWNYEIIDYYYEGLYPSIAQDNRSGLHVSYVRLDNYNWYLCDARRNPPAITEKSNQLKAKILFGIYPNPARTYLAVHLPQTADRQILKIFDVSGKLIKEIASVSPRNDRIGEAKISLKGINPGIYFLRFGTEIKKFLVVK